LIYENQVGHDEKSIILLNNFLKSDWFNQHFGDEPSKDRI
jgi:hypothetical protein